MNQEAIDYAKAQAELIKKNQAYQLEQAKIAEAERIKALDLAKQQSVNQLAQQKITEEESAKGLQQQEYLQKMLNQKSLNENLIRNGLGQTGARETTLGNLYANYGENVNKINANKLVALRDIANNESNVELNYGSNVSNVMSEEALRRAQIQAGIDENALNQYNTAYSQYVAQKQYENALKQQEYQNQLAQKQYEDALKQQAIENKLARDSYNESKRQFNLNYSKATDNSGFEDSTKIQIKTNYYSGEINPDVQYGVFDTKDKNEIKYQPDNVGGSKLTGTGKMVSEVLGDIPNSKGTTTLGKQNIWKSQDGNYYVWDGSVNKYIAITEAYKKYTRPTYSTLPKANTNTKYNSFNSSNTGYMGFK